MATKKGKDGQYLLKGDGVRPDIMESVERALIENRRIIKRLGKL